MYAQLVLATSIVLAGSAATLPVRLPATAPLDGRQQRPPSGAPQAPARDTKPAQTGTATIRGRVTAADTGAGLRRARVELSGSSLERTLYSPTDAQGRYEFVDVPAGRYTLTASKTAYVTLQFGQQRAFEAGRPVEVAGGAIVEKIDFVLPRGGVVSGTVTDDMGEAIAAARVAAFRSVYREGKRKLVSAVRSVETNDLGQYRLYGLQPGSYFIGTQPAPGPEGYGLAPSYYPGTLNPSEAQRVTVRIGQERNSIDLTQPPGRLVRLSGVVVNQTGQSLGEASVSLVDLAAGSVRSMPVKPDGTFSLAGVPPGEYGVAASQRNSTSGEFVTAMLPVTVYSEEISGLVLQLDGGCYVRGNIAREDGTRPPGRPSELRVTPLPLAGAVPLRLPNPGLQGIVNDDWTFELKGIGGLLLFRMPRVPAGYMLKSVLLDGRDITDEAVEVRGTSDVRGLELVLTDRVTEVAGSASDEKGQPAQYTVVIFADSPARWKYPSRFIATARPDQHGRYRVTNLPPARYLAVALDYLEEGQAEDPEFLESLRPLATSFALAEGESKSLELKIVKP